MGKFSPFERHSLHVSEDVLKTVNQIQAVPFTLDKELFYFIERHNTQLNLFFNSSDDEKAANTKIQSLRLQLRGLKKDNQTLLSFVDSDLPPDKRALEIENNRQHRLKLLEDLRKNSIDFAHRLHYGRVFSNFKLLLD